MDRLFSIILLTTITVFFSMGALLYRMGKSDMLLDTAAPPEVIQASFVVEEEKAKKEEEKPKPKPVEKKQIVDTAPVDLTQKPDPVKEKEEKSPDEPPPPSKPEPKPVRQVYGLKKVYSQGIGAGGDSQDAIVGKLGNTLNKEYDTLTATAGDLKGKLGEGTGAGGPVSSAASVTSYPRLKAGFRSLKPQYSKEMLQNRVEGVVKVKILIASDGTVKRVEVLSDIGYDSAEIAREFLMTLQFEPAMKGEVAVSVWIPFSIRFELI